MLRTRKTTILLSISLVTILSFDSFRAWAASTTASALQTVFAAISIAKVSDLNFGSAPQGDSSKTVASNDSGAASFTVSGGPGRVYTITIPSSATMSTAGGGAPNKEIGVSSFSSSVGGTGTIGAGGTQSLKVGATRAALANDQVTGNYSATFTVSVVY